MSFSQRIGKTPSTKEIQINDIDSELKNGLWNLILVLIIDPMENNAHRGEPEFQVFMKLLWHDFFKERISKIPGGYKSDQVEHLENRFFEFPWYKIYDFIEYLLEIYPYEDEKDEVIKQLNSLLERESFLVIE